LSVTSYHPPKLTGPQRSLSFLRQTVRLGNLYRPYSASDMSDKNAKGLPPGMRDPACRLVTNKVLQDQAIFEKYGAETNGEYTRCRVTAKPGGGGPLHYHLALAETFWPVKGTRGVMRGNETLHLKPGDTITVPLNTVHRFFNDGNEDIEFAVETRPAHQGFEQSIYIIYGLANDDLTDDKGLPSIMNLCLAGQMGDTRWPGLIGVAMNLFATGLIAYARWTGVEEDLLQRYWYS
jgi:mannose-6-phosphate isomerase-like protein (cupin superfamily)